MDQRIRRLVGLLFEDIPYSPETAAAEEQIAAALDQKYTERAAETSPDAALDEIISRYGKLSDMAALAGFSPEQAAAWREAGDAVSEKPLRKSLRRQKLRICCGAVCAIAAFVQLLWMVYMFAAKPAQALWNLLFAAGFGGAAWLILRRFFRTERQAKEQKYDTDAFEYLRIRSDRYAKRTLNSIALMFASVVLFFCSELSFFIFGNSKSAELIENVFANIILLEIPAFLLIRNRLLLYVMQNRIELPVRKGFRRHQCGIVIFSAVYWLIVLAASVLLRDRLHYAGNWFLLAGICFGLLMLLYNLTLRRRVMYRNLVVNKPRLAVVTALAVAVGGFGYLQRDTWYTQPYINSVPVVQQSRCPIRYDAETGVYTLTAQSADFRILHLTDIHLGGSLYSYRKDIKALKACYAEIAHAKPDLVIVTGDLCFPLGIMSMSLNNSAPVYQFAAFMRNLGVPWAFTYGNHDTESLATLKKQELNEVYKSLSYETSGTLLYPYVQPEITGRSNQMIEVRNADGSLNTALFLIDSNAYTGEGINVYDYIHDDQVDWYANEVARLQAAEGGQISSMAFFHIPLQQYRTAYELYESGSDEVTYFFGENGEKMINKVCCSDYPSRLFDRMLALGSTKAVFCGHDHYNNMSLEYKGIRLTYGMSIDYLAMPGIENDIAQRGAELITLHPDSTWDLEQIPLTSIS